MKKGIEHMLAALLEKGANWLGGYRAWRIFNLIAERNPLLARRLLEHILGAELPVRHLGDDFLRVYLGDHRSRFQAIWPLQLASNAMDDRLDMVPSEATPAERRLLFHFFKSVWGGQSNVLEIGPFLGGTTRAIGMGMMANPRLSPSSRLCVSDYFSGYYASDDLASYLKPLVARGVLTETDLASLGQDGAFRKIYERIHEGEDYYAHLKIVDGALPDWSSAVHSTTPPLSVEALSPIDAFFVDGAKSWFGTKYFFLEVSRWARAGAHLIFQDYGHFTCFWIPACLHLLRDHFDLLSYVDDTYVFQLMKPLREQDVSSRIPDEPKGLPREQFDRMFAEMLSSARERGDRKAVVSYQLQHAASLAYLGLLDEAANRIDALSARPESLGYESKISHARKTPTYFPQPPGQFEKGVIRLR
jgi:hypothetical protein